jgi:alkylation response protein AidB-like acyl-CoA dehydrogenase
VDFALDDSAEAFRAEVRSFLDEHLSEEVAERARATGTNHDWELHRALAARGWLAAGWPEEFGGQGRDPFEMAALGEEMARRGAPVDGWGTSELVANTLRLVGTPEQQAEVIPAVLSGRVLICLGYSEPDPGSDVAAAKTRAVRDGDEWVIDGQKMFTTLAHEAHYVFLLTRTNTDAPRHRGLTMFLVPMDSEGIEVAPLATLGGERANVTFYNGVRVPDSARVGEVDGGWDVMKVALAFERQPTALGELSRLLELVAGWARSHGDGGRRPLDDASVAERLARVAVDAEVGRLLGQRMTWVASRGELPVVEGSMAKLFTSEAFVRAASGLLDALGPEGLLAGGGRTGPVAEEVEHAYRHAVVTTIYGGSSEIQRSIIAERGLGLPQTR